MSLVIATKAALVADSYMAKAEEPVHRVTKTESWFITTDDLTTTLDVGWVGYMYTGKRIARWVFESVKQLICNSTGSVATIDFETISDTLLARCREYGEQNERLKDMLDATCLAVRIEINQLIDIERFNGGKRVVLLQIDNGFVTMDMTDHGFVVLGPSAVVCYVTGWLDRHLLTERRLESPLLYQCIEHAAKRMDYVSAGDPL